MSYIKLFFNFIKYLIIKNPIKLSLVIISIITFNYAGTFKGGYDYYDVVSEGTHGNIHIYVVQTKSTDIGYEIITSDKKENIKNGQIAVWNYNDLNVLFYVLFSISLIIVIIATIIGISNDDDDVSWETENCYQRAITTLIYCELENDTYHYMIMGRLIQKRSDQIRFTSNFAGEFRIYNISDIYRLPKFSTKTQKRNNILNKLGIN